MPAEITSCTELAELADALGGSVGRMSGEGDVILLSPAAARRLQAAAATLERVDELKPPLHRVSDDPHRRARTRPDAAALYEALERR